MVSKSDICFAKASAGVCGNGYVEEGEECDPGRKNTPCCNDCKLTQGSLCEVSYHGFTLVAVAEMHAKDFDILDAEQMVHMFDFLLFLLPSPGFKRGVLQQLQVRQWSSVSGDRLGHRGQYLLSQRPHLSTRK